MERRLCGFEERLQCGAPFSKWLIAQVAVAFAKQIEKDAGCRCFRSKKFDARRCRMDAELKSIELEPAMLGDDEFAIEHAFCGKLAAQGIDHVGEISIERFLVAALDEDLSAIPKNKHPKTIPLRLVDPFALGRHLVNAFGKHGQYGRVDGEIHAE
jgi:hypothetical protein